MDLSRMRQPVIPFFALEFQDAPKPKTQGRRRPPAGQPVISNVSPPAAADLDARSCKAITIRQPWAWLIVNGYKTIENRTWPTSYRGEIMIHAGKARMSQDDAADFDYICEALEIATPDLDQISYGGIVGKADLTDCITETDDPWFEGPYGFVLENAKPLPFKPLKGKLGIFNASL